MTEVADLKEDLGEIKSEVKGIREDFRENEKAIEVWRHAHGSEIRVHAVEIAWLKRFGWVIFLAMLGQIGTTIMLIRVLGGGKGP